MVLPGDVSPAPVASDAGNDLQTVGLTPLARGDGKDDERYALKVPLKTTVFAHV